MKINRIVVVALACGVVLWGEAIAADPMKTSGAGVPLAATEANDDAGFGDGPTPFPRPQPPAPTPTRPVEPLVQSYFVPVDRAFIAWSENATWWTRKGEPHFILMADGTWMFVDPLVFHDCLARAQAKTANAPPELAALVVGMQTHLSSDLTTALHPWKESFREAIRQEEEADFRATQGDAAPLPIAEINQRWQRLVAYHAEEIAAAVPLASADAGTCTTGRCDCKACGKKNRCDCQWYMPGDDDCNVMVRVNCNVEEPKTPTRGGVITINTRDGF